MKKIVVLFGIVSVLLTGCCGLGTNHFAQNYSNPIGEDVVPPLVKPEIIEAVNKSDYDTEISAIKSEGATVLGTSFFNVHSYSVCKSHLNSLAKKQGADFVVATREFTKQTRNVEPRQVYRTIYHSDGSTSGYWTTEMRLIIRNYHNYDATLLRAKPLEPIVP